MESSSFEDTCREMFGVHAYITFTIDKLVQNIVRQVRSVYYVAVVLENKARVSSTYHPGGLIFSLFRDWGLLEEGTQLRLGA